MRRLFLILLFILLFSFFSTNSLAEVKGVEYELPYPGLLPDSPLYFLKPLRDQVINFFISDSLKKAEFNLHLADKRLNAGMSLFAQKGKEELSISTISKGENYFENAISELEKVEEEGGDISDLAKKLFISTKKHQEVLKDLEGKTSKKKKASFISLRERVANFEKRLIH